ncbi:hypothetical protein G8J22_02404 [Lentilactobacillus hilgardii]|uniref:PD-(D/E)XK nuclease-like domain-containing protein n=1 Tax=Lentilactobacillus hilgardii TaxID=1588 RepID=UPI00019C5BFB|nr:PD-(D/E)XK nuclease-like domain-containing protein [Lentilactobacillus hilgardii]EEI19615.1 hypothetical protein HMPREF0497_1600 [Lentilactobacillus buchneri ATCC 11577]MCT3395893.1 hypothetical protein [Lentilactobacillus hilgardii]QIR10396.1 hypothetical protein G8J22_02404 [Lentilactobacillus hilgardii]
MDEVREALTLTSQNYYDPSTDWEYMSFSRFKQFQTCEAETLAELNGQWKPTSDETALLVGNYLHSYFESPESHTQFLETHPQILAKTGKNKGKPKAQFKTADSMIEALTADQVFNELYQGTKETIVTGKFGGMLWKGKIDCLNLADKYFVDLKTTRDLHQGYYNEVDHLREDFVSYRQYDLQMAIYRELIQQTFGVDCQPYIVAVTKQTPPDKAILEIPDEQLKAALDDAQKRLPHIQQAMNGEIKPNRCECCDYCRDTKRLAKPISIRMLLK